MHGILILVFFTRAVLTISPSRNRRVRNRIRPRSLYNIRLPVALGDGCFINFSCSKIPRNNGYKTMRHENYGLPVRRVQIPRSHHERLYSYVRFRRMQFGTSAQVEYRFSICALGTAINIDAVLYENNY